MHATTTASTLARIDPVGMCESGCRTWISTITLAAIFVIMGIGVCQCAGAEPFGHAATLGFRRPWHQTPIVRHRHARITRTSHASSCTATGHSKHNGALVVPPATELSDELAVAQARLAHVLDAPYFYGKQNISPVAKSRVLFIVCVFQNTLAYTTKVTQIGRVTDYLDSTNQFGWGSVSSGERQLELSDEELIRFKELLNRLPRSSPIVPLDRLLILRTREGEEFHTYLYDRDNLPESVDAFEELTKLNWDVSRFRPRVIP